MSKDALFYTEQIGVQIAREQKYLQDNHINFQYIEVDKYTWAADKVEEINNGKRIIPTLFIGDKSYTNPDNSILKEVLNIGEESKKKGI
ncbi:glutaredoxin family protein [Algibacter lectus]|uniref:glutaredoxin family protein n=1 Tax=Algibacter lectus TaxID=221126 RepID=UPI001269ED92